MHERIVEVETPDGRMPTFVTHPEQGGPFAPVVVYMDFWGIREELFDIARRIGTVGYHVTVPDLYYRQGEVRAEFRNADNRMISLNRLDAATQQRILEPLGKLTNQMVVDDSGALLRFLDAGEPVRPGPVGSVGYCMGGRHVLSVAGHHPDRFRAGASLHGTWLISERDDSPHLLADRFRGELYGGFAEHDPYAPLPMVAELEALLRPLPVAWHHEVHAGAEHGYALPNRDIHHKQGAERDWELIFAMYRRVLGLPAG
jgi:carboxymethylenebutenolidase